jgi:hypothetical protein
MEPTHEFKQVYDPLFCEEGDVAHLLNKDGSEFKSIKDKFYHPEDVPACNPDNTCEVIQDFLEDDHVKDYAGQPKEAIKEFLGEEDGSYDQYLRIKRDALREIGLQEDKITEFLSNIKNCISIINECKQEIDSAFNKYTNSWQ